MKILVAVDDSKFSDTVLKAVAAQFSPRNTEARIIQVVEPLAVSSPPQMAPGYAPELQQQVDEAQAVVDRDAKQLRDAGFTVDTVVSKGNIRDEIVGFANDWNADLIVLGSQGRKGIQHLLLGSVAESVARNAPCSVEIVRRSVKQQAIAAK